MLQPHTQQTTLLLYVAIHCAQAQAAAAGNGSGMVSPRSETTGEEQQGVQYEGYAQVMADVDKQVSVWLCVWGAGG